MSRLFGRKAVISIQRPGVAANGETPVLQFTCQNNGFDCRFDIRKDLTGKPNRATVDVFNLNREHRDALSEQAAKGPVRVRVEAGYHDPLTGDDNVARIFEGDIRILEHKRSGADVVTYFESGDGDFIISTARISKSWGPGTRVDTVIKELAQALGIGEGNVRASTAGSVLEGWGPVFTGGTAVNGKVVAELTRVCKSAGVTWSIQDGTLQFLATDKSLSAVAVKVTESTGMEGSPVIVAPKGKHPRRLRVKMRMIPTVFPGRKIQLEDKSVWRVNKAHYHGDMRGNSWGIDVEALAV